ncbi:MAG: D-aminoacylase [Planctomycetales bacterium]|nr:D-aminoacylase [Planctomycetales bacterium]
MNAEQRKQVTQALVRWVTAPARVDADVLLTNAMLHDGAGSPPVRGNVAISGDRIVGVGAVLARGAAWTIPCDNLVVCPGFIDLHNHSDSGIVEPATRGNVNFLLQGCTTIVTGNCGSGPVDTGAYYRKLDELGAGTNVAHLLPQGSLRGEVIGVDRRPPDQAELNRMLELAEKAMQDGAWGMSTGLIYVPSSYAETDELVAIGKAVAKYDGIYASHMRGEGIGLLESVGELLEIGRRAELPVHISHFKASGRDAWGLVREAISKVEDARASGQRVTADQYPYIASSTSLDATVIPAAARAGGRKALIERLDDSEQGPALRKQIAASIVKKDDGRAIRFARFDRHPEWAGLSLADVAKSRHESPLDVAVYVARHGGASIVNFSMNEEDVRRVMQTPWVATASDGRTYSPGPDRPHPRFYGTFPRKLGHYSLREQVLPLEQAIRSATGLPADILQLRDRGYLLRGLVADVVAFAPEALIDKATFDDPHQYSEGILSVLVNGKVAVHQGTPTGALAGRALRKPRENPAPSQP